MCLIPLGQFATVRACPLVRLGELGLTSIAVRRGELAATCRGRSNEEREEGGEVVWGHGKIFMSLVASPGQGGGGRAG
jgi:hypothetical protein